LPLHSRLITQQLLRDPLFLRDEHGRHRSVAAPSTVSSPFRGGDQRDRAVEIHRHRCGRDFCHVRFFESIAFYCYERFQVGRMNSQRDHAGEQAQSNFGAAVEILCERSCAKLSGADYPRGPRALIEKRRSARAKLASGEAITSAL
jgi:hypothetical protein